MKRKILLLLIIFLIFFILTFSFYYFNKRKKIVHKEVLTDFSKSLAKNNPEKLENYLIKYKGEDIILAKYIFSDDNEAKDFFEEFLNKLNEQNREQELRGEEQSFVNQTQIEVDRYSGLKGNFLKPEERFGIIIRKDTFVIISSSKEENNLDEVIKWFIKE